MRPLTARDGVLGGLVGGELPKSQVRCAELDMSLSDSGFE